MAIDLSAGEWTQLGIAAATAMAAAAAWFSVRVQIRELEKATERDRENRRYHELVAVFDRAGDTTGAITGRFQMFATSGHTDRTAAVNDLGRVSQLTAIFTLHNAPADVLDAMLRFGEHIQALTAYLPPWWWVLPARWWFILAPVPPNELEELQQLHLDIQRLARTHLEQLAPRVKLST